MILTRISATLGLADVDPVGGLVAGSLVAVPLDEGLEEDGGEGEAFSPVVLDAAGGQGEEMGGEAFCSDPGEDEEAGVVDDEGEAPLFSGHETIRWRNLWGRPSMRSPRSPRKRRGSGEGGAANLGFGKGLVSQAMVALDEVVPEVLLGSGRGGAEMKFRPGRE